MEDGFTNKYEKKVERRIEESEVKEHASVDDCWIINRRNVYDVTDFIKKHPGGSDLILTHAGADITGLLNDKNLHVHSANAYSLLRGYKIGELKVSDESKVEEYGDVDSNDLVGWKEDLVDWNQGMVFQVYRFGPDYLKWVHSPVNKKLKMFDSNFIEFFSKTNWYTVPLVWLPVVVICSVLSFTELKFTLRHFCNIEHDISNNLFTLICFTILLLAGIPVWTLIEYLLHRYLFHMEPRGDSPVQITLHFFFHGLHHKVPFDTERLVFPPVAASVFVWAFWVILKSCLPGGIGSSLFGGGLLGYVGYDLIHYYLHHGVPDRDSYLHQMKYYHVLHHFDDPSKGYGISSKFWDYPFNTVNKKFL